MRKFAISDIHGCAATFEALLDKIQFSSSDELYIVGDMVDRGPDSKGVIDRVRQLMEDGYRVQVTRGNHEQMMLDALRTPEDNALWQRNGGWFTMESFGAVNPYEIPKDYLLFLDYLPLYLEVDNYILVHAGLNFDLTDPFEGEDSMLWIRKWYDDINYDWLGDRTIVHGHTPVDKSFIEQGLKNISTHQYLDIDCGCPVTFRPDKGYLCAFEMTSQTCTFQKNIDKMGNWWNI